MSPSRRPRSERPAQHRPIRVVPMRGAGGLVAPAARVGGPPAAQLTYRGGPLLTAAAGVTVVAGSERSCQAFCGYHERSAGGLFYAVVPYPNCAGCLADLQPLDALTSVCSHELAEAITDPVPGQGWYDDSNGEIGDVCAWQNKKLGTYEVQLLWSNRAKACV